MRTPSLETKIEASVLHVRFDGAYWNEAAHGVVKIISVRDLGGEPRAGKRPLPQHLGPDDDVGSKSNGLSKVAAII